MVGHWLVYIRPRALNLNQTFSPTPTNPSHSRKTAPDPSLRPSSPEMARLLILASIFTVLVATAFGCSCRDLGFNTRYCNAQNSVRGRVIFRFDNCPGTCDPVEDQFNGRIYYFVQTVQKFKGTVPNFFYLSTAVNSGLCGVKLQLGQQYLLNFGPKQTQASIPTSFYNIGLCDFPALWMSLTASQKAFVQSNANNGASCLGFTASTP